MLTKNTIRIQTDAEKRAHHDALDRLKTATRNLIEDVEWTVEDPVIIDQITEKLELLVDECVT